MNRLLALLFFNLVMVISEPSFAQEDSTKRAQRHAIGGYPDTWLYRTSGPRFAQQESSIGIVPSIQGFDDWYFGLGISKARFNYGEWGGSGKGIMMGVDFDPFDRVIAPKINTWIEGYLMVLGVNAGISGVYYIKNGQTNFVLRPEVGIGMIKVKLNYGYNFFLRDNFYGISKHMFTLSYYHTFLPFQ